VAQATNTQPQSGSRESEEPVRLLARTLAHDFNNLIGAILGHASYLRMIAEPGSDVEQTAATIEMAAERARGLAAQLHQLGAAVPGAGKTPVDLHQIISEVASTLGGDHGGPVRYSLDLAAPEAVVNGDAGQLNQLLMNLAINAREAMGAAGGEIRIATARAADGNVLQLEVRDEGPGIPVEHRARVFEPVYTTKTSGGGLGLAIVQRIARDHGAALEIDGNEPRGAIFRVRFPGA